MLTVWVLTFFNVTNHSASSVAVFRDKAACMTTARIEYRAANPKSDTGRHFGCEEFSVSTEAGLDCEPFISEACVLKMANKPVFSPSEKP